MSNPSAYTLWEVPYLESLDLLLAEGTTVWRVLVTVLKQQLLNGGKERLFQ
jgi:hypothetical protein